MKNKYAFSLVEAMIILLIISITIMTLIPLISQKITVPRWKAIKDNNGNITQLNYGQNSVERVKIGEGENTNVAKFEADTFAYSSEGSTSSVGWTDNYVDPQAPNHTNSIVFGINPINASANGQIIIKSNAAIPATTTNQIEIGNNIIVDANGNLTIKSNNVNALQIGTDNVNRNYFKFYNLSTDNAEDTILSYDGNINIYDRGGTLNLGINTLTLSHDTYSVDPTVADASKQTYCAIVEGNTILFKDSADNTYCTWASSKWTVSDKRLKKVLSKYKKGQEDLDKISTYKFTYKNDDKKRLYIGVIAQQLIGIFDEALHIDNKGYYAYEREPLLYAMINSVKNITKNQNDILKQQKKSLNKADKLLRKYQ